MKSHALPVSIPYLLNTCSFMGGLPDRGGNVLVIGGSASASLAELISRELGNAPFSLPFKKRFPDGELYVRVGGRFDGEYVVLVQSTRSDEDLMELFLLEDAVREGNARGLCIVLPYFGYSRQDKKFFPGEPISARAMAKRTEIDADMVITVDLHSPFTAGSFTKPMYEVSGVPAIARLLKKRPVDMIISPDKGASERCKRMGTLLGKPWLVMQKKRIDSEHVEISLPEGAPDLKGKHVAILDDVISTGGTVVESAQVLKRSGVENVIVACTHGLFLKDAFERIKGVASDILATDTLENAAERGSVAPDIAAIIKQKAGAGADGGTA